MSSVFKALKEAKENSYRNSILVNILTTIGYGSRNQGLHPTHGAALGDEDVVNVKKLHNKDELLKFDIPVMFTNHSHMPKDMGNPWRMNGMIRCASSCLSTRGKEAQAFKQQMSGLLQIDATKIFPTKEGLPKTPIPTRKASGIAVLAMGPKSSQYLAEAADLVDSIFITWDDDMITFQAPVSGYGNCSERQIHYKICEHAMAGIANGLAAYHPTQFCQSSPPFHSLFLCCATCQNGCPSTLARYRSSNTRQH